MKNIILSVNYAKKDSERTVNNVIDWAKKHSIKIYALNGKDRKALPIINSEKLGEFNPDETIVASLGGDGTMLKTARIIVPYNMRLFGINLGSLGFLTQTRNDNIEQGFERILNGDYFIEQKDMIKTIKDGHTYTAVNEFTVYSATVQRMIKIKVMIDGFEALNVSADGIILSTATGSTAYSMAAGGPVLFPGVNSFIITPICPHNLVQRPIVINNDQIVTFIPIDGDCRLSADSQENLSLNIGEEIELMKYEKNLKLIQFDKTSFINVMREKFFLGRDPRSC